VYDLSKPWYPLLFCLSAEGVANIKMSCSHLLIVREVPRFDQPCRDESVPGQAEQPQPLSKSHIAAGTVAGPGSKDMLLEVLSIVNGQVGPVGQAPWCRPWCICLRSQQNPKHVALMYSRLFKAFIAHWYDAIKWLAGPKSSVPVYL